MCLTLTFIPRARMVDTEKERHVPTTDTPIIICPAPKEYMFALFASFDGNGEMELRMLRGGFATSQHLHFLTALIAWETWLAQIYPP